MALNVPNNLPAATIAPFAGLVEPAGWLFMAGQAVSRVTYSALFLAISTTYGIGDGSTTFNLPDARGRALFGKDNMGGTAANRATTGGGGLDGVTLGAVGGGEAVTLTAAQMPSHTHTTPRIPTTQSNTSPIIGANSQWYGSATTASDAQGSSGAHTNIPPALIINYIIKT